ncbi:type 4a pilus biogenesis protein PilO [Ferrimonas pelagia]
MQQLNELDFDTLGSWPRPAKIGLAVVVAILIMVAGYFLLISDSVSQWEQMKQQEVTLKQEFEGKYRMAANLPKHHALLEEMQAQFDAMLTMLPTANEMPRLLDSVTFLATDADLGIQSLNWKPELQRDFYVELPIEMKLSGDYHDFGAFSAGVAGLPRIVSLHDFVMVANEGQIGMTVLAKTYRFSELAASVEGGKQ